MLEQLKKEVYEANMMFPKYGLVTFTWGNVSGIDRERGLIIIKPSGVEYDHLKPEDMVVVDLKGNKVEGEYNPSSDTPTHVDYIYGDIPCVRNLTKEEIKEGYERNTGILIADDFEKNKRDYLAIPAVLCKSHGAFTWGIDANDAVHNAVVVEECARMAAICEVLNPKVMPAPQALQDKHYFRKHGMNAYYGQTKNSRLD